MTEDESSDSKCATPATPASDMVPPDSPDRRAQRIEDHLKQALEEPHPLLANVSVVNNDLMHYVYDIRRRLNGALSAPQPSHDGLLMTLHGIDRAVRVAKQIERFTQLEMRLKPAKEKALKREGTGTDESRDKGLEG